MSLDEISPAIISHLSSSGLQAYWILSCYGVRGKAKPESPACLWHTKASDYSSLDEMLDSGFFGKSKL